MRIPISLNNLVLVKKHNIFSKLTKLCRKMVAEIRVYFHDTFTEYIKLK